jgi:hypothetical protein
LTEDSSLTVWQSIEVLTKAIIQMQEEFRMMKDSQKITLKKGEALSNSGIYEAQIQLNNVSIATLPSIGYRMSNGELVILSHATEKEVKIPHDFHYLKVVKLNYNDYKLTFCNILGNEFFEYKKYDPQYSNVSDEYKFINLSSINKIYTPNLKEYLKYAPSFLIAEGSIEPGSQNHTVDLFELTQSVRGRKVGTFIDEFGYLDQDDHLHYYNHHEDKIYEPEKFSIKVVNTSVDQSSKFHLITENDNVVIHPIMENSCISDLLLL